MRLIIDTYNVLHTVGALPNELAGIDLTGLITLIRRSRYRGQRVDLVCDGVGPSPGPEVPGAGRLIAVHYSGAAREADDVIIDMVAHISHPRQVVVVSSDRRIAQAARRCRCGTLTAAKFLHRLALDRRRPAREVHPRPSGPLGADEVDEWIREFDLRDDELSVSRAKTDRPKPKPPVAQPSTKKKGKRRQRTDSARLGERLGEVTEFPDDVLAEADDLTRDRDADEPTG